MELLRVSSDGESGPKVDYRSLVSPILIVAISFLAVSFVVVDEASAQTPRGFIQITSDSDFTSAKGVVSGNGTEPNPYVIEGWNITFGGDAIAIENTRAHFIIRDCSFVPISYVSSWANVVELSNVTNGCIEDIVIHSSYDNAFRFDTVDEVSVKNVTMPIAYWVYVYDSRNVSFEDIDMGQGGKGGFYVEDTKNCSLIDCTVIDAGGIEFMRSNGGRFLRCNSSGTEVGLDLKYSEQCVIDSCTFMNNTLQDVFIRNRYNKMTNTTMGVRGLVTYGGDYDIDGTNTVNGSKLLYFKDATGWRIGSDAAQVILNNCSHFTIKDMVSYGTYSPLQMSLTDNLEIENVTLHGHFYGGHFNNGRYINITHSTISVDRIYKGNTNAGLYIAAVDHLTISNCSILSGYESSIHVRGSSGLHTLRVFNCTIAGRGAYGIDTGDWSYGVRFIIVGTRFHNCSVGLYITDFGSLRVTDCVFEDISSVSLRLKGTHEVRIEGNRISNSGIAILIDVGPGTLIDSNTIWNCTYGIAPFRDRFTVSNNTIYDCDKGYTLFSLSRSENNTVFDCEYGIMMQGSSITMFNDTIRNCSVSAVSLPGLYGCRWVNITHCRISNSTIGIDNQKSYENYVAECSFTNCDIGILAPIGRDLTVFHNVFQDCKVYAFSINGTGNHTFTHNILARNNYDQTSSKYLGPQALGNTISAYDNGTGAGNFWADYSTRYPTAKVIDDRYWSIPYILYGDPGAKDNYPLAILPDFVAPVAFAGENMTIDQNTTVLLNGTASWDDVGITNRTWSFAYGGEDLNYWGFTVLFTFDHPGNYTVTLTVRDAWGNTDSTTIWIKVIDTQPPIAMAGNDIVADMHKSFVLVSTGSWDNVGIVRYLWTIDPGGLGILINQRQVWFSFDDAGTYIATLNVSDAVGHWAIDSVNITVLDTETPIAVAGEDMKVATNTEAVFDGSGSSDNVGIVNWTWTFEYNGSTVILYGEEVSFTFPYPGEYPVTLGVRDLAGLVVVDALIITVVDLEPPVANAGPDVEVEMGTEVLFFAGDSKDNIGIIAYEWTLTYMVHVHTFTDVEFRFTFDHWGTVIVDLVVFDGAGHSSKDSVLVTVVDSTPPTIMVNVPGEVEQGEMVALDASQSFDAEGIRLIKWSLSLGDITTDHEGGSFVHIFDVAGTYTIELVVEDNHGNVAEGTYYLIAQDMEPPSAVAGGNREVYVDTLVILDGSLSSDNLGITEAVWKFRYEGTYRVLEGIETIFTFEKPGTYTIELVVSDARGNSDEDTMTISVLSNQVTWRVGPFDDIDGIPIEGVDVEVGMNGTTYSGSTDANGWLELKVILWDLVSPVNVTATKEGWQDLEFNLNLDNDGEPLTRPPRLTLDTKDDDKKKDDTSALGAAGVIAALLTVCVLYSYRSKD